MTAWIVRQNLGKARLARIAPDWVERAQAAGIASGHATEMEVRR